MRRLTLAIASVAALLGAGPAAAQSARDLLTQASFVDRDRPTALKRIDAAAIDAGAGLRASPGNREAMLMRALATGYRAKLTGSRGDAIAARKGFEALVARYPNDAEAQLALGAWHMGAVHRLGKIGARVMLGGQEKSGLTALDRAVTLGGERALFPGLSALLRLQADPADPQGRALAETAAHATTPTALDRIMQRAAATILNPLHAGDAATTKVLASKLLPLGRLPDQG